MASSSSLMASQTLILRSPRFLSPRTPVCLPALSLSTPKRTSLPISLFSPPKSRVFASFSSSSSPHSPLPNPIPTESTFTESTRAIASIAALAVTVSKILAGKLSALSLKLKSICQTPTPEELLVIQNIQDTVMCTVGPLFFACVGRPEPILNTPLTVVATGLRKWLRIYSAILMIRVLLSWFPNIPWDRQPLSALRDLCDPYLNLFRSIIPPLFNALDISPIFAFWSLGILASVVNVQ